MITQLNLALIAKIKADTTLRTLLGMTPTDARVYQYYAGNAVINSTQRAYITYALTAEGERTAAVDQPVYTLAIWAIDYDTANAVRDRLLQLFDADTNPAALITDTAGRVYQPVKVGQRYSAQEDTQFKGITLQFRFGTSHV